MNPAIDVAIEAEDWSALEALPELAEAAIQAAMRESRVSLGKGAEISVLFCNDSFIRELNRKWRGIDKATNVLAFPAGDGTASARLLGDIVVAFETASREAAAAGKPLRDHVAHLLVHGSLHLIGLDHAGEAEAAAMEAIERAALARLAIADPYRATPMGGPSQHT